MFYDELSSIGVLLVLKAAVLENPVEVSLLDVDPLHL